MAASSQQEPVRKTLDLRGSGANSERGELFWNTSEVEMKFSIEREWIKSVRTAKRKPCYGMMGMDNQLEEVIGNKLELTGPLIDSYLREIGKSLKNKLSRSKATGLVNPITQFIPWAVFRHILTLVRGYSGDVDSKLGGRKQVISITKIDTIKKLFSPSRFSGETYFAHRHFMRKGSTSLKPGKKMVSVYNGRSSIVVSAMTPFCMDYSLKTERVTITFFIQRYTSNDFAVDTSLQSLMNCQ